MKAVLIVDDSLLARRLLGEVFGGQPGFRVLRPAASGELALQRLSAEPADVIVLDLDLPGLGGLGTLAEVRRRWPRTAVFGLCGATRPGAADTLEAHALGATDVLVRPSDGAGRREWAMLGEQLLQRVGAVAAPAGAPALLPVRRRATSRAPVEAMLIGVSTGGPNALAELLPQLPASLPVPVLVVQHMPPVFTEMLAQRLDQRSALTVHEAQGGECPLPGHVYLAPGDRHLRIVSHDERRQLVLDEGPPENSCRPAVDVLFRSAARAYGSRLLAVMLTGMGQDGLLGCQDIVAAGGSVIAQDKESSVVWGMPGAVVRAGLAERVLPLGGIADEITRRLTGANLLPQGGER